MFSFEGEFCRRPVSVSKTTIFKKISEFFFSLSKQVQNLSGFTSNLARDRDSLIKNAQVERQKREQARREHHSSLILTSVVRSFLERKKFKQILWTEFHDYIKLKGLIDFQDLDYLLKRLLHFYDSKRDADQVVSSYKFWALSTISNFTRLSDSNLSICDEKFSANVQSDTSAKFHKNLALQNPKTSNHLHSSNFPTRTFVCNSVENA